MKMNAELEGLWLPVKEGLEQLCSRIENNMKSGHCREYSPIGAFIYAFCYYKGKNKIFCWKFVTIAIANKCKRRVIKVGTRSMN